MVDTQRREQLLAEAVRAGKFTAQRAEHYRQLYDSDPAGTEQVLAALAPVGNAITAAAVLAGAPAAVLAEVPPYPRELFPELVRRERRAAPPAAAEPAAAEHVRPGAPPAEASIRDEQVARWSAELFPETQAQQHGRITRAND